VSCPALPSRQAAQPADGIDSGGPAYHEAGGVSYVVEVSSCQSTRATGGREGMYGVTEFYTRVSSYVGWIAETVGTD